ncbi:protein NRT1/ PTR FAMILY 4.7-like [Impatiens glandulifera]|uniref:protein NRT1/ PTR FAMILY 4.7-like n=1 Tax=Impatiens glandulifera TaxID=253017 RepID=UPI001FB17993|nr:protein NRT1/ PTR FAMILY 4.7-like [Impatiens glandulifera]
MAVDTSSEILRYVNWKNEPAVPDRHGGILAASFVLVVEVLENLAYLANASNLVLYLTRFMGFSPSGAANTVTNFMGTAFILALLGGFLCDAFFTSYYIYLASAVIEFLGLLILTVQAHAPSLRPSSGLEKHTLLFGGLYLVALGVGGIKGSLPPHGAEQFDENTTKGRKQRSTFFNYYIFSLACGALIAVTFVVWIEDNKGWQWGFGIATASILISIPVFLLGSPLYKIKKPSGSPITTIVKVLFAAIYNSCRSRKASKAVVNMSFTSPSLETETNNDETSSRHLKILTRAMENQHQHSLISCTLKEVEEVSIVLKILPIFMSTIMLNCCLAQLSTFSIQQASTMNTMIGSFKVPPASLPIFPVIFIMALAPIYNHVIVPLSRKLTKTETGITHLQRIGTGLFLSIMAMAIAARVEMKRKRVAETSDTKTPLPITFLWISLQYLFLGSADLFSLAGMMEFFFTEAPFSMRSLATSLSWASLAMGYYLSSALVSAVNGVTSWLEGSDLNHYHLERFYWLMCILSVLNFFHYLLWACRYKYRLSSSINTKPSMEPIISMTTP